MFLVVLTFKSNCCNASSNASNPGSSGVKTRHSSSKNLSIFSRSSLACCDLSTLPISSVSSEGDLKLQYINYNQTKYKLQSSIITYHSLWANLVPWCFFVIQGPITINFPFNLHNKPDYKSFKKSSSNHKLTVAETICIICLDLEKNTNQEPRSS